MKNIMIVDHDPAFISDLQARLIIDEPEDMNIYVTNDAMQIGQLDHYHPDLVAASSKMLHENVITDKFPLVHFAHSKKEKNSCPNPDYDFLGITPMTSQLILQIQEYLNYPPANKTGSTGADFNSDIREQKGPDYKKNSSSTNEFGNKSAETMHQESYPGTDNSLSYIKNHEAKPTENQNSAGRQKERYDQNAVHLRENLYSEAARYEPARGITVYSAKGGVGKTTIACELASMLACTEHGRSHYKVCIADFNIDFGDVINQLDFDPKKPCMTHWIADIRNRLTDHQKEEDISYTAGQISEFLQVRKDTGLFALLAPLTNQDSMDIKTEEIEIMVRNLIDNGGFDFVIFDTGNNTRDSSYIPMLYSEQILVVLTQSINTANCCNGFFTTMAKINFDMGKFRLVLNRIQPQKVTGLDPEELREVFRCVKDKDGKILYRISECYAQIKESNAVISSGNDGIPLVVKEPSHEFSRGIANIMANITKRNYVLPEAENKGFISKIFGNRKGKVQ